MKGQTQQVGQHRISLGDTIKETESKRRKKAKITEEKKSLDGPRGLVWIHEETGMTEIQGGNQWYAYAFLTPSLLDGLWMIVEYNFSPVSMAESHIPYIFYYLVRLIEVDRW